LTHKDIYSNLTKRVW